MSRNSTVLRHRGWWNCLLVAVGCLAMPFALDANPYLPKPGEPPMPARVGSCSITGGFVHLYSALFNGLFEKYGIRIEHVTLRGGVVSLALK